MALYISQIQPNTRKRLTGGAAADDTATPASAAMMRWAQVIAERHKRTRETPPLPLRYTDSKRYGTVVHTHVTHGPPQASFSTAVGLASGRRLCAEPEKVTPLNDMPPDGMP